MAERRQRPQDAGVADQDVELLPALVDGGAEGVDLFEPLQVQGEQGGTAAQALDLVVELLQRTGGAPDQDQVRTFPGVGQRHRPANAAGGSGDEGETAGETFLLFHGPTVSPASCGPQERSCQETPAILSVLLRRFGLGFVHQVLGDLQSILVGLLRGFLGLVDVGLGGLGGPFGRLLGLLDGLLGGLQRLLGIGPGLLARVLCRLKQLLGADGGQLLGALDEPLKQRDSVGSSSPALIAPMVRIRSSWSFLACSPCTRSGLPVNSTTGVQAVTSLRSATPTRLWSSVS